MTTRVDLQGARTDAPDGLQSQEIAELAARLTADEIDPDRFNVGNVSAATLAPIAGTPDGPAMAEFGQVAISRTRRIRVFHIHMTKGGTSGSLTIEWYRLRNPFTSKDFTFLGSATLGSGIGNFVAAAFTPSGDAALVEKGDYLLAQATAATLVTAGNANGLTLDVHYIN